MQLSIKHIVPIPLKEKTTISNSDVWNKECTFSSGEFVKIKASSGSGKTTLIHILYKLRNDFSGSVLYNQEDMRQLTAEQIAQARQQHISIVFQDLRLFPQLTIRENIELKRVLQKPLYENNMIDTMANRLGIGHILQQKAMLCSYGEQQRAAIIRALIQPFEILLLDEPFSHLDQANSNNAATLIEEECAKRNAGFILTDLDDDDRFNYTRKLNL